VLHAYDATNLTAELYNSTQAQQNGAARDAVHATGKFTVPVVVNGHVYIATQNGVDVFGLLP
jgi:thiamine monophosphate synthase